MNAGDRAFEEVQDESATEITVSARRRGWGAVSISLVTSEHRGDGTFVLALIFAFLRELRWSPQYST